jgi:DUF1680 family protein
MMPVDHLTGKGVPPVTEQTAKREFTPVAFTRVSIEDDFWGPRIETTRRNTIPHVLKKLEEAGSADSFRWREGQGDPPHVFFGSDVAKWIEAAAYSLAIHPDPKLGARIDDIIQGMKEAQGPDGYLNPHYLVVEQDKRWTNLRDQHELYCAGHLIEAAVAYYSATGKRDFLDIMCRNADHIDETFGPGKRTGYPGHEEIELALVKLYHVTGEERYLRLSQYFVDERGKRPHFYEEEARARGEDPEKFPMRTFEYNQSHKPVREQDVVVGHAVRGMYLFAGMADLAHETGDPSLLAACRKLWDSLTLRRMYVTGGIGPSRHNEGFTGDYDLPNETAYAETCAAIALVFWASRMVQWGCDRKYADVMERALYNGVLSGISLDGTKFFYVNPLESKGEHHRQDWFGCACCPTNIVRLLPSLGGYAYSRNETDAAVHLYIQGSAKLSLAAQEVTIRQETQYPWSGHVSLSVHMERSAQFGLRLRIPGWCRGAGVAVNGESIDIPPLLVNGYVRIEREWQDGDKVELELLMPVMRVRAHPEVRADVGKVALQRGPIVYCLEQADNAVPVSRVMLPAKAEIRDSYKEDLLGGVVTLSSDAEILTDEGWDDRLYRTDPPAKKPCRITAVPYYAWDNREAGEMVVWVGEG